MDPRKNPDAHRVRLCRLDELQPGDARGCDSEQIGEDTVVVLRRGDTVLAYVNRCPHQSARLEYRKDRFLSADGQYIVCHAHGAYFDPDTGACVRGACLGESLQPLFCAIENGWVWTSTLQELVA